MKLGQSSVTVDPGLTWTNLYSDISGLHAHHYNDRGQSVLGWFVGWIDGVSAAGASDSWLMRWLAGPMLHGAGCPTLAWHTPVWLAMGGGQSAADVNGRHFKDCKDVSDEIDKVAKDDVFVENVWKASETLIESVFG